MIGVGANVLLRAVLLDDPRQAKRAHALLEGSDTTAPAVVNSVVLAEFVWSLRSVYKVPRSEIITILRDLVGSRAYLFLNREAVLSALNDYENGFGGFTDRLIAEVNAAHGCEPTFTFDAEAAERPPSPLFPNAGDPRLCPPASPAPPMPTCSAPPRATGCGSPTPT